MSTWNNSIDFLQNPFRFRSRSVMHRNCTVKFPLYTKETDVGPDADGELSVTWDISFFFSLLQMMYHS